MNFFKLKQSSDEENPLHHVFSNLQTHFTNFLRIPNPNPNPNPFSSKLPSQARTVDQLDNMKIDSSSSSNLSVIKERLKDVPVYRLKSNHRHPLARSDVVDRSANLFFFSEADAQDSAADYNTVEFNRKQGGLQTLKVPLAEERQKAGFHGDTFTGVPVFQSDALKVRVDGSPNNLSPAFFRKVTALEDIIQEMKVWKLSTTLLSISLPFDRLITYFMNKVIS
ncbi:hypothetical protein MIMGU_mgv11b016861mg [Erythranthe guttata]|uniref:Uncharacterized protein n=1 Tax=Erythranthe guttata TaxID=4155 RepID=A0A022RCX3_ERYGU|nr:hypothetical protein MIMGU_mgv11b016861mg [Erythranthe guttata]